MGNHFSFEDCCVDETRQRYIHMHESRSQKADFTPTLYEGDSWALLQSSEPLRYLWRVVLREYMALSLHDTVVHLPWHIIQEEAELDGMNPKQYNFYELLQLFQAQDGSGVPWDAAEKSPFGVLVMKFLCTVGARGSLSVEEISVTIDSRRLF
eukprot:PhF_6_TR39688/c0_g2_i1/m.58994